MAVVGAFGGNAVNYFEVGKEEHKEPGSYHYHCSHSIESSNEIEICQDISERKF